MAVVAVTMTNMIIMVNVAEKTKHQIRNIITVKVVAARAVTRDKWLIMDKVGAAAAINPHKINYVSW